MSKVTRHIQVYIYLSVAILGLLMMPKKWVHHLRLFSVESLTKSRVVSNPHLESENHSLKLQLSRVREWLLSEERLDERIAKLQEAKDLSRSKESFREFYAQRAKHLAGVMDQEMLSLQARVVFREPSNWNSFMWIDQGSNSNDQIGFEVIAEGSPVLSGHSIVGVVEEVQERRAKVRLITDEMLTPSVRAMRGLDQDHILLEPIGVLLQQLRLRDDLLEGEEREEIFFSLSRLESKIKKVSDGAYYARGFLKGSSESLWRSKSLVLKGVGFNHEFEKQQSSGPLLQEGDLLVTTGLDGVFPAGFPVASVTKIAPLKEGAVAYDLEAVPTAGNLHELSLVRVLPPS